MTSRRACRDSLLAAFGLNMIFLAPGVRADQPELKAAATRIADGVSKAGKKRVAVVDFTDLQGSVTELGRFFAEELSVTLATESPSLEVIDRTHLKALLQEHKLAATGVIDPQTARRLGDIAGVEALVTGSITPFGDSVRLSMKALDSGTARLLAAATLDIPRTKAVEELLARGVGSERRLSEAALAAPSAPPLNQAPPAAGTVPRVVVREVAFELERCAATGENLRCDLLLTNLGTDDREIKLAARGAFRKSRLIDNSGGEYSAVSLRLGESRVSEYVSGVLTSGIRTKCSVSFASVPGAIAEAALMEVIFEVAISGSWETGVAQFRRVPIS